MTDTPPDVTYEVYQSDAVNLLSSMRTASRRVDLIIMDPAYESIEKHRAVGTTTRLAVSDASSSAWFPSFPNARFSELLAACYKVLRAPGHMYVFCDHRTMFVLYPLLFAAGFFVWKPIIWDKAALGMGYHYREAYEVILFCEKRTKTCAGVDPVTDNPPGKGLKLNNLGTGSIIGSPVDSPLLTGPDFLVDKRLRGCYPTQKPAQILRTLIEQSTQPGELVVDPFCGSGSTGAEALRLGRSFVGGDIYPQAVEHARAFLDRCHPCREAPSHLHLPLSSDDLSATLQAHAYRDTPRGNNS